MLIRIACSGRYILYVNGVYVGRGPARSGPQWKSCDIHDLTHTLRSGRNTVAALGYHYDCQNNYTRDDRAGFWAQVKLLDAAGSERTIGTDGQWKVRHAEARDRNVDLINSCLGVTEVYDARLDPAGWTMLEFDDEEWDDATVIPPRNAMELFGGAADAVEAGAGVLPHGGRGERGDSRVLPPHQRTGGQPQRTAGAATARFGAHRLHRTHSCNERRWGLERGRSRDESPELSPCRSVGERVAVALRDSRLPAAAVRLSASASERICRRGCEDDLWIGLGRGACAACR